MSKLTYRQLEKELEYTKKELLHYIELSQKHVAPKICNAKHCGDDPVSGSIYCQFHKDKRGPL